MYNGHMLRQFFEADSGSGFDRHIDEADDAENSTLLFLSALVKLTDDPPCSDGSWMQVEGCEPVMYGRPAGSVIIFVSRRPHWSLRTPLNMGKVLKIALFYKFIDPQLIATFAALALPTLSQPLLKDVTKCSVLPPCRVREACLNLKCPLPVIPQMIKQQHLIIPQVDGESSEEEEDVPSVRGGKVKQEKPAVILQTRLRSRPAVTKKEEKRPVPERPVTTGQAPRKVLPLMQARVDGETEDTASAADDSASVAESLEELSTAANMTVWGRHMSKCNKEAKKLIGELEKISEFCAAGTSV
jgi:hypothetical protein